MTTVSEKPILKTDCMDVFDDYVKNEYTRHAYLCHFNKFLKHFSLTEPSYLLTLDTPELEQFIKLYVRHLIKLVNENKKSPNSLPHELDGIKHFLTLNDKLL